MRSISVEDEARIDAHADQLADGPRPIDVTTAVEDALEILTRDRDEWRRRVTAITEFEPAFEVSRALGRLKSWADSRSSPNELGWDAIERDVQKVTDALLPCLGHRDRIAYLEKENTRQREENRALLEALNTKERERREHRDAIQAWADLFAVARPTGKNLKKREDDLWDACSLLGLRVPLVVGPGPETESAEPTSDASGKP